MLQSEFDLCAIVSMKPVQAASFRDELEHGEHARALLHRAGSGVARCQRRREFRRIARDFRGPMIAYTSFHFRMLARQRQWSLALPFLLRSYVVRFYCQLLIVLPFFVHWLGFDARRLAVFLDARMGDWYKRMDSLEPMALSRLRSVSKTEWLALALTVLSAVLWWVSIEMPDPNALSHLH